MHQWIEMSQIQRIPMALILDVETIFLVACICLKIENKNTSNFILIDKVSQGRMGSHKAEWSRVLNIKYSTEYLIFKMRPQCRPQ